MTVRCKLGVKELSRCVFVCKTTCCMQLNLLNSYSSRATFPSEEDYIVCIEDPPTGDRRPTTDQRPHILENFKWPYLREGSSDPLHVWFYGGVFEVGGSNGAISGFAKSKVAARPPSSKIQMATSPRRIIRFTPCLVLGWGFRGRRIEWRYFRYRQLLPHRRYLRGGSSDLHRVWF